VESRAGACRHPVQAVQLLFGLRQHLHPGRLHTVAPFQFALFSVTRWPMRGSGVCVQRIVTNAHNPIVNQPCFLHSFKPNFRDDISTRQTFLPSHLLPGLEAGGSTLLQLRDCACRKLNARGRTQLGLHHEQRKDVRRKETERRDLRGKTPRRSERRGQQPNRGTQVEGK
jgi:hypothetical protein